MNKTHKAQKISRFDKENCTKIQNLYITVKIRVKRHHTGLGEKSL